MNGIKAKALRRAVYGDLSLRIPREYTTGRSGNVMNKVGSPRERYQRAKRAMRHASS